MKSIHWLLTILLVWTASTVGAIFTSTPEVYFGAVFVTFAIVIALGLDGSLRKD